MRSPRRLAVRDHGGGDTGGAGLARCCPGTGSSTLADLSRSLLASLGVPGEHNVLGLPLADRACLLVVDGLGWDLLRAHQSAAPFLAGLAETGCWLTAGFPSTTVTSLSSLGTGRPPGQHGLLGYQVRVPATGQLLNALRWDKSVDPVRLAAGNDHLRAGGGGGRRRVPRSLPGRSGRPGCRRPPCAGPTTSRRTRSARWWRRTAAALARRPAALAMVYTGDLDATGHAWGCTSAAWRFQLGARGPAGRAASRARCQPAPRCTSPPITA